LSKICITANVQENMILHYKTFGKACAEIGNPSTTDLAFDKPVELHWWTCGDKVIGYDRDSNPWDPRLILTAQPQICMSDFGE
jgi:hypothetical protein